MARDRPTLVNVVHSLDPGGAERLVVDMSLEFSTDYDVHVFCLDKAGAWAESLREKGVPVRELRRQPGTDIYLAWRLAKACRELSADIIHAHQSAPWFYSALSRLFFRQPKLLFEEHGRLYPEPDNRKRRFLNRLFVERLTHMSVAVSKDLRERLIKYEGLKREGISVIYNGGRRSPAPDRAQILRLRREFGFDDSHLVVGFVGRLDPVKNVSLLLNSVGQVKERHPNIRCLIVGDGDELPRLRREVADLGIADEVVFAGYRSDADQLIHSMNIFALPSLSEGTSMALLEAMSAGIPAVVTGVGGNVELIENGVSGYVVKSDSVTEFSAAICDIADDPEKACRSASKALKRFEEKFSFGAMIDGYRRVYESLLHGGA